MNQKLWARISPELSHLGKHFLILQGTTFLVSKWIQKFVYIIILHLTLTERLSPLNWLLYYLHGAFSLLFLNILQVTNKFISVESNFFLFEIIFFLFSQLIQKNLIGIFI